MRAIDRIVRRNMPYLRGFSGMDLLLALVLGGLIAMATSDAWHDLITLGMRDEESSHVQLTPFVVAWIIYVRRSRLRQCRAEGRLWAMIGITLGYALWLYGYSMQRQAFWHAGAVVMTVSAVLVGLGNQVLWRFLPAFGALIFLVPVPTWLRLDIAIPMQAITAATTQQVCEVLGMGVSRTGNLLSINGTDVAVAEACNGMRMVFTLLMVVYAFTFTEPLRTSVRLLILALSPAVAVVANVARLVPTVWAYGTFSTHTASRFHDVSGWVMLVVAFMALAGIIRVLRWAMVPVSQFNLALS